MMSPLLFRLPVLLAAALLAGCAGAGQEESLSASASAAASAPAAEAPAEPPRAAAPSPPPAPAPKLTYQGRGLVALPPPSPPTVAQAPVMTIEKARGECWMQLDRDKKAPRDLEKRAKLVETCADAKMKAAAAQ